MRFDIEKLGVVNGVTTGFVNNYTIADYVSFEVYECPTNPNDEGRYIGKTPNAEQAINACKIAYRDGTKFYFIKGVKLNGEKVVFL